MAITYIWNILSMPAYPQAEGEADVIFQVNWSCNANDGMYAANSTGSISVTYVAGTLYIPYSNLTQEQVWAWVNPKIDRAEIESNLQALINSQKIPKTITLPLPWN